MPLFVLLLTLLASAALPACRQAPAPDARLLRAEALMDEHPDSALALLQSLDTTAMNAGPDSCLYRLLIAEANCKNHLGLENDTLLDSTIDYFKDRDDALHLSKAYYYAGKYHEFNGNLRGALVMYIRSKHVAETDTLWFRAGMAAGALGDIAVRTEQNVDELAYYSQAVDYLRRSGNKKNLCYELVHKSTALARGNRYDDAERILRDSVDSRMRLEDPFLDYYVQSHYGTLLLSRYDYSGARPWLEKACASGYATPDDSLRLSYALSYTGQLTEGKKILGMYDETSGLWYNLAKFASMNAAGNFKDALLQQREVNRRIDQLRDQTGGEELQSLLEEEENDRNTISHKLKKGSINHRVMLVSLLLLILMLTGGATAVHIRNRRFLLRKDSEIKEILDQLIRSEHDKEMSVLAAEDFRKLWKESQAEIDKSRKISRALRHKQTRYMKSLCRLLTGLSMESAIEEKRIVEKRKPTATSQANQQALLEFVNEVNVVHEGILDRIASRLPVFTEKDRIVLGLEVAGFNISTIAFMSGYSDPGAIYARRTRIKEKLRLLSPADLHTLSALPPYYLNH